MTPFDLLFLLVFLGLVVALLVAAVRALRGRFGAALQLLKRAGLGAAAYMGVVVAVALVAPGRSLGLGENDCSDDWCIAVAGVRQVPGASSAVYEVTFRVSSRARRASQRERDVLVYLRDAQGHRYQAEAGPSEAPFDVLLAPLETVTTVRRFDLPRGTHAADVVVARGGMRFPLCCIVADPNSLFHRKTAFPIPQQ